MKKGFTLIGLTGVMVIVTIIMMVSFLSINNMLAKTADKDYKVFLNTLYEATESYIVNNPDLFTTLNNNNTPTDVTVKTLVDNEYLKSQITNPKTKKVLNVDSKIRVNKTTGNQYTFTFSEA